MCLTFQLNACYVIDMTRYLVTATGFPVGGSGRETCTKIGKRQLFTKRKKYTKQYKSTEYTK